jgi:hypothetical protein
VLQLFVEVLVVLLLPHGMVDMELIPHCLAMTAAPLLVCLASVLAMTFARFCGWEQAV